MTALYHVTVEKLCRGCGDSFISRRVSATVPAAGVGRGAITVMSDDVHCVFVLPDGDSISMGIVGAMATEARGGSGPRSASRLPRPVLPDHDAVMGHHRARHAAWWHRPSKRYRAARLAPTAGDAAPRRLYNRRSNACGSRRGDCAWQVRGPEGDRSRYYYKPSIRFVVTASAVPGAGC